VELLRLYAICILKPRFVSVEKQWIYLGKVDKSI